MSVLTSKQTQFDNMVHFKNNGTTKCYVDI